MWRYSLPPAIVILASEVARRLQLGDPWQGVLVMGVLLLAAWFGGLGPSLLLSPTLLFVSRMYRPPDERWAPMPSDELLALAIITLVSVSVGLAGQYRRRAKIITERSAQKLKDQARALGQAPIVFRNMDGMITDWSEGAERLFGYSAEEALGQPLHQLLDSQLPCPFEAIQEEIEASGHWRGEVAHRHKTGKILHVAASWILYRDQEGAPIGVAEVNNDVSELRAAEEALRDANRRKNEFLAMLSHELRNPLAPIRTGLEIMRMARDDPKAVEATREVMDRQLKQLVTLVDDLLDVSRITRGQLKLRKSEVALSSIIQNAVEAARPSVDLAGHRLSVTLPDVPIYLNADPNRLSQVISNLLDNAAKYTPRGGEIRLTAEVEAGQVAITISDNGFGIPEEMLGRVFEMFTRSDHEADRMPGGLGIGLALVKSIVEMHDGEVKVQSAGRNKGATFVVRLPLLEKIEHPAILNGDRPCDKVTTNKRRILVVDDNQAAARLMSDLLEMLGNDVCVGHDGLEAVELAERFQPEVIFMDLGMPHLDGFGAAARIRQESWGKEMLLVAVSGWGQDVHKQRSREAGFDHHLVKPADVDEIQHLLAEKPARSQRMSVEKQPT